MASVVLEEVSKAYPGGVRAVDRVSLEIGDEELVVLVGPSGCGKTTTLRLIAGLERPTSGDVRLGGRSVLSAAPKDRDIALVFQGLALYPHLSVYKNLALPLELRCGGSWLSRLSRRLLRPAEAARLERERQTIPQRVHTAAQMLDIEPLLSRRPGSLSGGERQRVALGRAVVRQPAAFLFDEPLSNLDAPLRAEMRRQLAGLHRSLRATMIYVTHDQVEALALGQRIVVMQAGRIQQVGSPLEVYDRPRNQFVAGFLGSPPMGFVEGALEASGQGARFVGGGLDVTFDPPLPEAIRTRFGRRIILGVRPEDLRVQFIKNDSLPKANAARAQVAAVESLGDSALVHLELTEPAITETRRPLAGRPHSFPLIAKIFGRASFQAGDLVHVTFDPRRSHLFDSRSGENLLHSR